MNVSGTAFERIDTEMVTPIVRQALGHETTEVTSWEIQQVHGGAGAGTAGGLLSIAFSVQVGMEMTP
jgi:hypothetical protein